MSTDANGGSSDTPPQSPPFTNAPGASPETITRTPWTDVEKANIDRLKQLIASGKLGTNKDNRGGRASKFMPYLLVRAFTGDNGSRPINQCFWESPDIWTAVGDPSATPAIPPTHGGTLPVGQPNTVYAHVWNLGRAPVVGVVVTFSWCDPSLAIDGTHAHPIGMTRVDLGPRNSPACHRLVKCPKPWIPVMENGGHECLVVRVSGFGDQVAPTQWSAAQDRRVAQRNVAVVANSAQMKSIVTRFAVQLRPTSRVELTQVGAEAKDAVAIVAPRLTLDPSIATLQLANLDAQGTLHVARPAPNPAPRILPHALTVADEPATAAPPAASTLTPSTLTVSPANITSLVDHSAAIDAALLSQITVARPPAAGQAQVLRMSQYDGTTLTGGYTFVVGNPN